LPNPSSNIDVEEFRFVGRFIGSALQSNIQLGLNLHPIVWKYLLNRPLTVEDFHSVDTMCFDQLKNLLDSCSSISVEQFEELDIQFIATSIDNQIVELLPNGSNISVSRENLHEYARLVTEFKMHEMHLHLQALKSGFDQAVSSKFPLPLLSSLDLKTLVEGRKQIDVDVLKFRTRYQNCTALSPVVSYFWDVLKEFSDKQRCSFLKFLSGSPSLPIGHWKTEFTIYLHDFWDTNSLPVAHTCSWQLDIPNYPSKDTLRKKLLLALRYCSEFAIS
jgi:E3 ubiquitin-protein ligase HUWE1